MAVSACKSAWSTLLEYCEHVSSDKAEKQCDDWKDDPASFLDKDVLEAKVNPIDAGYKYASPDCSCFWVAIAVDQIGLFAL